MTQLVEAQLRMYGKVRAEPTLSWEWVSSSLKEAPLYWLATTRGDGTPHARPVHGIWSDNRLLLSNGSWNHHHNWEANPRVSVHLESGTDVVVVEGRGEGYDKEGVKDFLEEYNPKYGYTFEDMLPPLVIVPEVILAWQTLGPAGRDGFGSVGKWVRPDV